MRSNVGTTIRVLRLRGLHGQLRQVGLPGSRRQHDHSQASRSHPGRQRLALMRVRGHLKCRYQGEWTELGRLVHQRRALRA